MPVNKLRIKYFKVFIKTQQNVVQRQTINITLAMILQNELLESTSITYYSEFMPNTILSKLTIACTLLMLTVTQFAFSQIPRKLTSTLSIGGTSKNVYIDGNYYFYQQSVGQESIIGVNSGKQFFLRQGFIQPLKGTSIYPKNSNELEMAIHPNPFNDNITLTFNDAISDVIIIKIYNTFGQLFYNYTYSPTQEINLDLGYLSQGLYIANVSSNGKQSSLKLIKN